MFEKPNFGSFEQPKIDRHPIFNRIAAEGTFTVVTVEHNTEEAEVITLQSADNPELLQLTQNDIGKNGAPLHVNAGDVINFIPRVGNETHQDNTVSGLFEFSITLANGD